MSGLGEHATLVRSRTRRRRAPAISAAGVQQSAQHVTTLSQ
ncbi:hypothetical protein I552_0450 [Mycobacterium xenopi 3993]|nr:hypothetical protein I552_0450 [Mycobacterium xenopi 3993]